MGGIHKKDVKHFLRKFFRIKTWVFLIALAVLLFIEATILRINHLEMLDLRAEVMAADESEDDVAIVEALTNLRNYVQTHTVVNVVEKNGTSYITFGTGPIYLEHQYVRKASEALAAAEAEATTDENPNGNVFAKAMDVCKPLAIQNGWAWNDQNYINCFMSEIAKYPTSDTLEDSFVATLPSTGLFRYDFASPIWTPSLFGFLAIVCAVLVVIILVRFLIWIFLRVALLFLR